MTAEPTLGTRPDRTRPALWALRVAAVLAVASVLWQAFSAAGVIVDGDSALGPHAAGAIVVHVMTGLMALAALGQWWTTRGPIWPAVLSIVVFAATLLEARLGHRFTLWAHVPTAMLIMVGTVVVLAWAAMRPSAAAST